MCNRRSWASNGEKLEELMWRVGKNVGFSYEEGDENIVHKLKVLENLDNVISKQNAGRRIIMIIISMNIRGIGGTTKKRFI